MAITTTNLGLTIPAHNDPGATWEPAIDNDLQIIDTAVGANSATIATVQTNLNNEATTRATADTTNANAISAEVTRATTAEALLLPATTAASTYAPLNNPTCTGTVTSPAFTVTGMGSFQASALKLAAAKAMTWSGTANWYDTLDTGISRLSAGVIAVGNGTAGNTTGNLQLSNAYHSATLGAELAPALTAGNWTLTNFTAPSNTLVHTTGTVGTASANPAVVPTVGTWYKVVVTMTGGGSKYTSVNLGGSQGVMLSPGTYTWFMLASSTSNLTITNLVTGDPSYTITALSVKALTTGTGGLVVDGATQLNGQVSLGSLGIGTGPVTPTAPLQVVDINANGIQITRNAQPTQYLALHEQNGSGHYIAGYGGDKPFIINNQDGTAPTASGIQLQTNGATRWIVESNLGHLVAGSDNTYDIGVTGANRPRNLYVAGKVKEYNGVTTAGIGIPVVVATQQLTGQTAAISITSMYTPATAGVFRMSMFARATTAATAGTINISYNYNDGTVGGAQSLMSYAQLTANNTYGSTAMGTFNVAAGQTIYYTVTFSGVTGSPTYLQRYLGTRTTRIRRNHG